MIKTNTYIQQIKYETTYTKGRVVDLLSKFHVVCKDFPFKKYPEAIDLPERVWEGADGADVYVPDSLPMKSYTIDVEFLYTRERATGVSRDAMDATIRSDISSFLDFICGRIGSGVAGDSIVSPRLAIYNEYVAIGRKDVVVSKVDNDIYFFNDNDDSVVVTFKVTFKVYDPTTDVTPVESGGVVNNLSWS